MNNDQSNTPDELPSSLILLLASATGLAVASLYYSHPMLGILGADIGASNREVGLVPTLTQLGYALGSLLLAEWGWIAVTGMATIMALAALATRLWPATNVLCDA